MKWPSVSPDLNPIENLWDFIDNELRKMKPTNVKELEQMIQTIWDRITCFQCKVLVDSMPRRIDRCIKCGVVHLVNTKLTISKLFIKYSRRFYIFDQ